MENYSAENNPGISEKNVIEQKKISLVLIYDNQ